MVAINGNDVCYCSIYTYTHTHSLTHAYTYTTTNIIITATNTTIIPSNRPNAYRIVYMQACVHVLREQKGMLNKYTIYTYLIRYTHTHTYNVHWAVE